MRLTRRSPLLLAAALGLASPLGLAAVGSAQPALLVQAGSLVGTVPIEGGHLGSPILRDTGSGATVRLADAFVLAFAGGRTLRSSAMGLAQPPRLLPLAADASASRAAARLPGQQICAELTDLGLSGLSARWCLAARGTAPYLRQELTLRAGEQTVPVTAVRLLSLQDSAAHVVGSVPGSPIVSGNFYLGFENPLSESTASNGEVSALLQRTLPIAAGQEVTYTSVVGLARPGQMRRDLLAYLELERAHPYRTFLHYNTWYDLGEGQRFSAADVLNRMHAFGDELVRQRGVTMDSFLMDDGWDNTSSLWQFNSGFPDGFTPLESTAKQYGFGLGVWLSPWGGYDKEKDERIAFARANHYELVDNLYALSGPRYYPAFEQTCLNFVTRYGVNQFKIDGTGNAGSVFPGSLYDSDFAAAIHLIERLRQEEPALFVNLTTGTKPSPFWLRYADSIYRSGEDHDFAGEGTWRQRWITYRDEQTFRNIVQKGPLFPLNSLMLHGIIYAQKAEHLENDPGHDFADEVHSFFGSGTDLQEMYLTPSLLAPADWDTLAESARWSRANAATLVDTHWVGGDPGNGAVYGWAAWGLSKAILTLRNPSPRPQSLALDPQLVFELPPGASGRFRARSPWAADRAQPAIDLRAHHARTFHLRPFEVLVLEATPTS